MSNKSKSNPISKDMHFRLSAEGSIHVTPGLNEEAIYGGTPSTTTLRGHSNDTNK